MSRKSHSNVVMEGHLRIEVGVGAKDFVLPEGFRTYALERGLEQPR